MIDLDLWCIDTTSVRASRTDFDQRKLGSKLGRHWHIMLSMLVRAYLTLAREQAIEDRPVP